MAPARRSMDDPPDVMHSPHTPSTNTIRWRTMVINWAGSMVLLGFCAPMLVWMAVYCIRTRSKKDRSKNKRSVSTTATNGYALRSLGGEDSTPNAVTRIQRLEGRHQGVETFDPMPLDPGPPAWDHNNKKIPKITHLSRYLGWWSSGTSREESYPPDPRARKKGAEPLGKREHFTRFVGWYTSSEHEPNLEQRRYSDPGPDTRTHMQQSLQSEQRSDEAREGDTSSGLQSLVRFGQRWRRGRHMKARTSLDDPSGRERIKDTDRPFRSAWAKPSDQTSANLFVPLAGPNVRVREPLYGTSLRSLAERKQSNDVSPETDEISEQKTVRRRPVGIAEACDWVNLSNELRRSVHSQALLHGKKEDASLDVEDFQIPDVSYMMKIAPVDRIISSPQLFEKGILLSSSPRLRKVRSSPTLHIMFKDPDKAHQKHVFLAKKPQALCDSSPGTLGFLAVEEGGIDLKRTDALLYKIGTADASYKGRANATVWTRNVSQVSLTYSFDKTRRSTLDVIATPLDSDRFTLDEYEAESSIDAEIPSRDCSGSVVSSHQEQPLYMGSQKKAVYDTQRKSSHHQRSICIDCMSPEHSHKGSYDVSRDSSSQRVHIPTSSNAPDLQYSPRFVDNMATSNSSNGLYLITESAVTNDLSGMGGSRSIPESSSDKVRGRRKTSNDCSESSCYTLEIPYVQSVEKRELIVSKTRTNRDERSKTTRTARARKLTPFIDLSNSSGSRSSLGKYGSKDWHTMKCLCEAISVGSENESPLKTSHGAVAVDQRCAPYFFEDGPADTSHSSDHGDSQAFATCPSSPRHGAMPTTSIKPFMAPVQVSRIQED